jgi:hypothetical protein
MKLLRNLRITINHSTPPTMSFLGYQSLLHHTTSQISITFQVPLQTEFRLSATYGQLSDNSTTRKILLLESTSTFYPGGTIMILFPRVLNTVSSDGRFSITSNASYINNMNVVMGDLFVGINPNTSVTDTTILVNMQASNFNLFDQTLVCFSLSNNATGLAIYVCGVILS